MSTPEAAAEATEAGRRGASPRNKSKKQQLLLAVPLLALCGGGAYAYGTGLLPFGENSGELPSPPVPVLEPGSTAKHPRYKTSYYKIDGAFTTNLAGSARFVQVEIGVSTVYDATVLAQVQTHELPIRSAVLGVLAQQSEDAVQSPAGRAALQRQLKVAVNRVLVEREGFGGVSDVYLTGLIVQ